jgi:hypothetical protein
MNKKLNNIFQSVYIITLATYFMFLSIYGRPNFNNSGQIIVVILLCISCFLVGFVEGGKWNG